MKVIAYTVGTDGKLVFGKPTLWSWFRATWCNGGTIKVKPIRGYEEYLLDRPFLCYQLRSLRYTDESFCDEPIAAILWAERGRNDMYSTLRDPKE